ncbi:rCG47197 [Rattus norvegicus]|uniref:RCG47197 n=1 Tax=Rattus norvegicus TaxID=10116 RepID=A6I0S8_RAT|nr:rCG47197 [Rattus norvegicus]
MNTPELQESAEPRGSPMPASSLQANLQALGPLKRQVRSHLCSQAKSSVF